ncbi:MAG TPA: LysM domain-containing protein [Streptosporangiaceae bacterium]|nr:LysM domain-containing protein [Streptosporangiaceae bacterium]
MRMWTKSACVVLAWSILSITVVAVGMKGSVYPAQVNTRTESNTEVTLTGTLSVAAAVVTATSRPARYVVRRGDTLSGIAARFSVRGGWPALYAANQRLIGSDPNVILSGAVVVLPGQVAPVRYIVAAGDTLSGIAAGFAVRGGWPGLYTANRQAIGADPNAILPGTVLTVARPAALSPPAPGPAHRRQRPVPPPSPPAGTRHHPRPVIRGAPHRAGMPQWLKAMLLAVGLFILVAFLAEPVLVARRRRQQAAVQALQRRRAGSGRGPGSRRPGADKARIVLADHDRLVVTCSKRDGTVYVLRPPGEDPKAILRVARLVLAEGPYRELADQLGVPASWPMECPQRAGRRTPPARPGPSG